MTITVTKPRYLDKLTLLPSISVVEKLPILLAATKNTFKSTVNSIELTSSQSQKGKTLHFEDIFSMTSKKFSLLAETEFIYFKQIQVNLRDNILKL